MEKEKGTEAFYKTNKYKVKSGLVCHFIEADRYLIENSVLTFYIGYNIIETYGIALIADLQFKLYQVFDDNSEILLEQHKC